MTGEIYRWITNTQTVQNYGWPWMEGNGVALDGVNPPLIQADCFNDPLCGETGSPTYTDPVRVVSHELTNNGRDALLGGFAYRGNGILKDMFVFGLFGNPGNPSLLAISAGTPSVGITLVLTDQAGIDMDTWPAGQLHGLGQGADGELYVIRVDVGPNEDVTLNNGRIYKILQ